MLLRDLETHGRVFAKTGKEWSNLLPIFGAEISRNVRELASEGQRATVEREKFMRQVLEQRNRVLVERLREFRLAQVKGEWWDEA